MGEAFRVIEDELVFQTEDAVPVVARSFPIAEEKVVRVDVLASVHAVDMSAGAAADFIAVFARRTGGNLARYAQRPELIVTTFSAPQPNLSLNANQATQNIDVQLTGKAGLVLRWHLRFVIRETA